LAAIAGTRAFALVPGELAAAQVVDERANPLEFGFLHGQRVFGFQQGHAADLRRQVFEDGADSDDAAAKLASANRQLIGGLFGRQVECSVADLLQYLLCTRGTPKGGYHLHTENLYR